MTNYYCLIPTLADAQFVGAFDAADKVYFMLREIAIEQINCAKVHSTEFDKRIKWAMELRCIPKKRPPFYF